MTSVSVDMSELRTLAARLDSAPRGAAMKIRAATRKGAVNIKDGMRSDFAGSKFFRQVAPFVTFDVTEGADFIEAEIGPRAEGAGLLENIAYFGTSRGGGTIDDPEHRLDDERPTFLEYIARAGSDVL